MNGEPPDKNSQKISADQLHRPSILDVTEAKLDSRIARRAKRWASRQAKIAKKVIDPSARKIRLGEAGTCRGHNIDIGHRESEWTTPPEVKLQDGSTLRLYKDGQGMTAALRAIQSAREQICLESYIFNSDETGREFAKALADKAKAGVKVFLIYDSFGSIDSDPAMFLMMRQAGVQMVEFHPIRPWDCKTAYHPTNRDHRKLLVIDNIAAGLGGLNVGTEYGSGFLARKTRRVPVWRDNSISIVGPSAAMFTDCFTRIWRYAHRGGKLADAQVVQNISFNPDDFKDAISNRFIYKGPDLYLTSEVGLLASVSSPASPLVPFLISCLRQAKSSVDLTMAYFAPTDNIIMELIRCIRRGVKVRLMVAGACDVPVLRLAARSFYEILLSHGVEVYERMGAMMHSKTMTIDQSRSWVGSTNLDSRSIEFNCELSAIIDNIPFAKQMTDLFEHDICYSQKIELHSWRNRPWFDRTVQWVVRQTRYLL